MKTKSSNTYNLNQRNKYLIEAKSHDFLNAVFCIYFYNKEVKKWGDKQKMPDMSPIDVFNSYNKKEYDNAIEQCIEVFQSGLKHGDLLLTAIHHKNDEESTSIRESFLTSNPCFKEINLERALKAGMTNMR